AVWGGGAAGSAAAGGESCGGTAPLGRPWRGSGRHSTSDGAGPAPQVVVPARGTGDCEDTAAPGGDPVRHAAALGARGGAICIRCYGPYRSGLLRGRPVLPRAGRGRLADGVPTRAVAGEHAGSLPSFASMSPPLVQGTTLW